MFHAVRFYSKYGGSTVAIRRRRFRRHFPSDVGELGEKSSFFAIGDESNSFYFILFSILSFTRYSSLITHYSSLPVSLPPEHQPVHDAAQGLAHVQSNSENPFPSI
jgi:hypothetical protein